MLKSEMAIFKKTSFFSGVGGMYFMMLSASSAGMANPFQLVCQLKSGLFSVL
jgi:hypothetical protein